VGKREHFPIVFDPRLKDPDRRPAPVDPEFQGDLDSLFHVVDAQMVDRRAARPPDTPTAVEGGRRADDHQDMWIGFGIEEFTPGAPGNGTASGVAAPAPPVVSAQQVADLVIAAIRDQMKPEIREQVRAAVKECVDEAVRDAAGKAPPPPHASQPRRSPGTMLSIRWHQPFPKT
jgi:hypothetical protein